ncbi:hypothetical protein [Poseidonocella sp. HB161398]|uniref:hypothetical protein n=1 Tax=Poseidonocella sp. HB161398 TaxID=2320855 RepID=UPI0011089528|nr:hypothetical protein [Poseidonocella sp. HB161398]
MRRRIFLAGMAGSAMQPALAGEFGAEGGGALGDMARIGQAVLAAGQAEPDAAALRRSLGLAAGQVPQAGPDWAGAIAADFTAGRVALVEGWVLSRTEAQLCALAACCEMRVG